MKESLKLIKELFKEQEYLYSGSYVLKELGIIDREVGDVDLVFHKNYYEKVKTIIKQNNLLISQINENYPNSNLLLVVQLKNGKHIDIFFELEDIVKVSNFYKIEANKPQTVEDLPF